LNKPEKPPQISISTNHTLGVVRESVRIYCNDPTTKSFVIRISGYIKEKEAPEISITPKWAVLDLTVDLEEGVIEKFILKNSGAETVKIISIKPSADYLVALLKEKAREKIKEDRAEEYLYLTVAVPIIINNSYWLVRYLDF